MPVDGALDYVELPGSDIPGTRKFYAATFGWTFVDYGPEYVAFNAHGRDGGFNSARKVISSGGPLIVIYANDLEAMEKKIKAAGAEITSRENFEGGRRFHFCDPNGNEIAVWTKS